MHLPPLTYASSDVLELLLELGGDSKCVHTNGRWPMVCTVGRWPMACTVGRWPTQVCLSFNPDRQRLAFELSGCFPPCLCDVTSDVLAVLCLSGLPWRHWACWESKDKAVWRSSSSAGSRCYLSHARKSHKCAASSPEQLLANHLHTQCSHTSYSHQQTVKLADSQHVITGARPYARHAC